MLRKLKIALRLSASFAVLLVFLIGGTGVGLLSTGLLHQRMAVMVSQDWVSAQSAARLKDLPQDSATALLDLFRVTEPDEMEKLVNRVYANRTNFVNQLKGIEALATAAEEKACVAKIREGSQTFDTSTDKVIEMFLQGRRAEAVEFLSRDSMVKLAPLQGTLKSLFDAQGADMKRSGEQADSAYQTNRLLMIILGGAAILAGAALAFFVTRSIVQPVRQADVLVTAVAAGDLTVSLETDSRDEIGDITRQLNSMVTKLRSQFGTLKRNSGELQESSGRLGTYSTQVSANSEETSVQVSVVAAAAEQVSKNVATVATAAEEMTAAIREVAQQAGEAANVAGRAVQVADTANRTISKLGDSSTQIGNVIKVINSIAEQTNLLALNATIEAARAGEAGKGFAVVANEVKELARQTAKATEEISQRINSIQSDTAASVSAIQEISGIIAQINQIQTVIAGSVEEQAVTTNEISKNATEAATGSAEIARNITGVSDAALSSTKAATNVAGAAGELGRLAVELNRFAGQFCIDASAADTASPSRASAASETALSDLIQWDPARMATGVATVDEQHQELITRINQLQSAIRNCAGADEIEPMLAYLGDYTVKHFSHEEGLMESHACPSRQANLEAHKRFLENFTALAETYRRKGPTMEVLETLKKTVQDWLVNHICTIDHKLKGCTTQHANGNGSSNGNGKSNGRASMKFHASKRR